MRLLFTDLPDEKPRITGIKEKYQIGERLEALCTSWQSHPPANLTWWINEEKVMLMMVVIMVMVIMVVIMVMVMMVVIMVMVMMVVIMVMVIMVVIMVMVMVMMMMMEALCTSWQSQPPPNLVYGLGAGVLNRGLVKI